MRWYQRDLPLPRCSSTWLLRRTSTEHLRPPNSASLARATFRHRTRASKRNEARIQHRHAVHEGQGQPLGPASHAPTSSSVSRTTALPGDSGHSEFAAILMAPYSRAARAGTWDSYHGYSPFAWDRPDPVKVRRMPDSAQRRCADRLGIYRQPVTSGRRTTQEEGPRTETTRLALRL